MGRGSRQGQTRTGITVLTTLPTLLAPRDLQTLASLAYNAPVGNFAEIGVYRGGSASMLYRIAEQQGRILHLYDTFAGHPDEERSQFDDPKNHPVGRFSDCISPDELQTLLPNAVIHIGTFPETLVDMSPLAFVHADADLYVATKAICITLPLMMVTGGQLYFDDYSHPDCGGCRQAVDEIFGSAAPLWNGKRLITLGVGNAPA